MPSNTNVGGIRMRALGFISSPGYISIAKNIMEYVLNTDSIDEEVIKGML
jgi:hypothetical protein